MFVFFFVIMNLGLTSGKERSSKRISGSAMTPRSASASSKSRQVVSPEVEVEAEVQGDEVHVEAPPAPGIFGIWRRMSEDYFGHGPSAWRLTAGDVVEVKE